MKAPSKSTMDTWWRRAVLAQWGGACAICGSRGTLECHHIVRRHKLATRWDWRNGLPMCVNCHRSTHDVGDMAWRTIDADLAISLRARGSVTIKEYLSVKAMTRAEWMHATLDELKRVAIGRE